MELSCLLVDDEYLVVIVIPFTAFLRAALIKLFSPYGKIVSEDFLWHTRGPKRGEPRGFAFIQYSTKEVSFLLSISFWFSSNSSFPPLK